MEKEGFEVASQPLLRFPKRPSGACRHCSSAFSTAAPRRSKLHFIRFHASAKNSTVLLLLLFPKRSTDLSGTPNFTSLLPPPAVESRRSPRRFPSLGFKSFFPKIMSRIKPQKVGSDSEPPGARLQANRRTERGFLRKKEEQGSGRMTLFETTGKKSVGAKRTLLRRVQGQ